MNSVMIAKIVSLSTVWIVSLVFVALRSRFGERSMWHQVVWSSVIAVVMVIHFLMI